MNKEAMRVVLYGDMVTPNEHRLRSLIDFDAVISCVGNDAPDEAKTAVLMAADAVVAVQFRHPVKQAPRLRLLQLQAAGYDFVDFACVPDQAAVCNAYGHAQSTAEYAVMAMLMWSHRWRETERSFRAGSWDYSGFSNGPKHSELQGKTVGVLGLGHIGMEVAAKARAMGTRVMGCSRSLREPSDLLERFYPLEQLDAFLAQCDFVVLCLALTPETTSLINARRLACMKPEGVLINIARGALVAEQDLYEALTGRVIAGAALDVWWQYPSPEQPGVRGSRFAFQELDNVMMSPHASAWSEEMMERRLQTIVANLRRLQHSEPLQNVVRSPVTKLSLKQ